MDLNPDLRRASRRSYHRDDAPRALASRGGRAYPAELADDMAVTIRDLHMIMHGYEGKYRSDLSPVALGLVKMVGTPIGDEYVLTERGWAFAATPSVRRRRPLPPVTRRGEGSAGGPGGGSDGGPGGGQG